MYVVAFVTDRPGTTQVRAETQEAYRAYLLDHPAHPDIVVHHAGPTLGADGETPLGLLLVAEAPSVDAVRAFLDDSPYASAGVFGECDVREWDWYTGRPE